ncbi:hypothetical protein BVC80_1065g170 [Macleaya cordata]|uniref:Uncharacterized protein n=1 Tax=Macleaya cordata TaxID=56857 RepID=A0A200RD18_MACCD|nr:hypothetical protein BVC80_1065g170 [Macleaya cordata]
MLIELVELLDQHTALGSGEDEIRCKFAVGNNFSAKKCYMDSMEEDRWEDGVA